MIVNDDLEASEQVETILSEIENILKDLYLDGKLENSTLPSESSKVLKNDPALIPILKEILFLLKENSLIWQETVDKTFSILYKNPNAITKIYKAVDTLQQYDLTLTPTTKTKLLTAKHVAVILSYPDTAPSLANLLTTLHAKGLLAIETDSRIYPTIYEDPEFVLQLDSYLKNMLEIEYEFETNNLVVPPDIFLILLPEKNLLRAFPSICNIFSIVELRDKEWLSEIYTILRDESNRNDILLVKKAIKKLEACSKEIDSQLVTGRHVNRIFKKPKTAYYFTVALDVLYRQNLLDTAEGKKIYAEISELSDDTIEIDSIALDLSTIQTLYSIGTAGFKPEIFWFLYQQKDNIKYCNSIYNYLNTIEATNKQRNKDSFVSNVLSEEVIEIIRNKLIVPGKISLAKLKKAFEWLYEHQKNSEGVTVSVKTVKNILQHQEPIRFVVALISLSISLDDSEDKDKLHYFIRDYSYRAGDIIMLFSELIKYKLLSYQSVRKNKLVSAVLEKYDENMVQYLQKNVHEIFYVVKLLRDLKWLNEKNLLNFLEIISSNLTNIEPLNKIKGYLEERICKDKKPTISFVEFINLKKVLQVNKSLANVSFFFVDHKLITNAQETKPTNTITSTINVVV